MGVMPLEPPLIIDQKRHDEELQREFERQQDIDVNFVNLGYNFTHFSNPDEYVLSFLNKLESHDLDFKEKFPEQVHSIGKIISAFANHSGGRIFLEY